MEYTIATLAVGYVMLGILFFGGRLARSWAPTREAFEALAFKGRQMRARARLPRIVLEAVQHAEDFDAHHEGQGLRAKGADKMRVAVRYVLAHSKAFDLRLNPAQAQALILEALHARPRA